jgi:transposase-like protein
MSISIGDFVDKQCPQCLTRDKVQYIGGSTLSTGAVGKDGKLREISPASKFKCTNCGRQWKEGGKMEEQR